MPEYRGDVGPALYRLRYKRRRKLNVYARRQREPYVRPAIVLEEQPQICIGVRHRVFGSDETVIRPKIRHYRIYKNLK